MFVDPGFHGAQDTGTGNGGAQNMQVPVCEEKAKLLGNETHTSGGDLVKWACEDFTLSVGELIGNLRLGSLVSAGGKLGPRMGDRKRTRAQVNVR